MKIMFRLLLGLVTGGGLVTWLFLGPPSFVAELGWNPWSLPELYRHIEQENQRRAGLDIRGQVVIDRIAAKEAVIEDLIADRLSLKEAVARFRSLNEAALGHGGDARRICSDAPRDESSCHQVLSWVKAALTDVPAEHAEEVCRHLHEEARQILAPGRN
jgi:hypothetical protein